MKHPHVWKKKYLWIYTNPILTVFNIYLNPWAIIKLTTQLVTYSLVGVVADSYYRSLYFYFTFSNSLLPIASLTLTIVAHYFFMIILFVLIILLLKHYFI